jgi:hypothetical protein
MIKSLSAFGILALLATAVVALPGFAPVVQASETVALAKGDRLDIVAAEPCNMQTWPNLTQSCLRAAPNAAVREARLVTAARR